LKIIRVISFALKEHILQAVIISLPLGSSSRKKQGLMLDMCEFSAEENVLVQDNLKWRILH